MTTRTHAMALLLALSGCGGGGDPEVADQSSRPVVVAVDVVRDEVVEELVLSGDASPWAAVEVVAEAAGRLTELPIEIGRQVSEGQILARIDDEAERVAVAQAEAALRRARAAAAQSARDLERGETLASTRDISDGELDRLRLAAETDGATAAEAEAALRMARTRLEDTEVRAPIAGVIAQRYVDRGAWLNTGSRVCRIVDRSKIKVRSAVSADDRPRLAVAMAAAVTPLDRPEAVFEGRVRLLGEEADPATSTYLVEVEVREPAAAAGVELLPGMPVRVAVELERREALVIPRQAVLTGSADHAVFVVSDEIAHRRAVTLGATLDDRYEILDGLRPDDVVLARGHHALSDGDRVEVTEP